MKTKYVKSRRIKYAALAFVLTGIIALTGCASQPDPVEDPLSAFGIDAVLPFATIAPEAAQAASTPAPTVNPDDLPTDQNYGQDWRQDGADDPWDETPTPKPTPKPTPRPTARPAEPEDAYERLSYGDTGDAVKKLQKRLKSLGYYNGSVDGQYGAGTVAAVKLFQSVVGLSQSGTASASLQEEIFSSGAPKYQPAPTPKPTATPEPQYIELSRGSTGSRVTRLQNRLKTLGYYSGTVDGDYGSGTVAAVKLFQEAIGLKQTGTASVAMQKKLFSSGAPEYERTTPAPQPDEEENYIRLAEGSFGSQVKKLEKRLKALGYFSSTADNDFDSDTAEAVMRFQKTIGVSQTGIATVALQKKLFADNAPEYNGKLPDPDEYTMLSPGDSGSQVKKLQKRLKELGYFDGEVAGNYLTKTTEAVKKFQKAIGVKETGIATASLQKKLFASNAPRYEAPAEPTPEPAAYTELQKGDSGTAVKKLQKRLKELGYFTGTASGNYGNGTVRAVKAFEAQYGKEQTGIATVALQKKLFAEDALPYSPSQDDDDEEYKTLKKGSTGAAVKTLQRRLKDLGYFEGEIGGHYQQLTIDAVKLFQKAVGLEANGTADSKTQKKLYAEDAPIYKPNATPSPNPYKPLKKGDTGDEVLALQKRLFELGYIRDAEDVNPGTFDKNTQLAVIDAQNDRGYDSDGVADEEFLIYLYSEDVWEVVMAGHEGG